MSEDRIFRLILVVGLAVLLPIGIWHRVKAHSGEKLDRLQEGLFILITLRLCGLAAITALIAYLINPASMGWATVPLPAWARWMGIGFAAGGAVLLTWTFRNLGRNLTDTVVTRKAATLVTTGPYRWVRHPFYLSVALVVLANSLLAANWFLFTTGVAVVVLQVIRTRKEEHNLIAKFGDDYRTYMGQTGRFLPRLL